MAAILFRLQCVNADQFQVSVDCDEGVGQLQLSSSGEVNLVGADGLQGPLVSAGRTFSLQTLINLGLHRAPKES